MGKGIMGIRLGGWGRRRREHPTTSAFVGVDSSVALVEQISYEWYRAPLQVSRSILGASHRSQGVVTHLSMGAYWYIYSIPL